MIFWKTWHLGKWEQYSQGRQVKLSRDQFVIPGSITYTKKETITFHSRISAVQDLRWMFSKLLEFLQDVENPWSFLSIFFLCYQFSPFTPDCLTAVQNGSSEWIKVRCVCVQLAGNQNKQIKHLLAPCLLGSCDRKITYSVSLRSLKTTRNRIKLHPRQCPANLAWQWSLHMAAMLVIGAVYFSGWWVYKNVVKTELQKSLFS